MIILTFVLGLREKLSHFEFLLSFGIIGVNLKSALHIQSQVDHIIIK